jgi:hypothetical protein
MLDWFRAGSLHLTEMRQVMAMSRRGFTGAFACPMQQPQNLGTTGIHCAMTA